MHAGNGPLLAQHTWSGALEATTRPRCVLWCQHEAFIHAGSDALLLCLLAGNGALLVRPNTAADGTDDVLLEVAAGTAVRMSYIHKSVDIFCCCLSSQ